jgi:peptide/nickel transport system permease protein
MSLTTVQTVEEVAPLEAAPGQAIEGRSPFQLAFARIRGDRLAWVAAAMIVFVALLAILAPLIALATGHQPEAANVDTGTNSFGQPLGPGENGYAILGTDNLGRDILVRIAYGARVSLLVGVAATGIATLFGIVVGLVAGYYGGWIDTLLARLMDVVLSFPYVLFAVAVAAAFGPSLFMTIVIIAFFSWAAIGRIVRGQALSQREKEYVEAAHSIGASNLRIMFVDILPNLLAPVIVLGTLLIPVAIVFEATLSFLGVGIVPPTPSWGNMLSDAQGNYIAWWWWVFPMIVLLITTLGFNLLGDAVRDALDPRTERIFAAHRKRQPEQESE